MNYTDRTTKLSRKKQKPTEISCTDKILRDIFKDMTEEMQFRALTPEERAEAERKLEEAEAEAGICLSCGA